MKIELIERLSLSLSLSSISLQAGSLPQRKMDKIATNENPFPNQIFLQQKEEKKHTHTI
jgi:hypothetical protein